MDTMFLIFVATVLAGVAVAILVRRQLDERARRREQSRRKTVELREKYWADQMEASRERVRREQLQRASKRDLQRMANERANQRLDDVGLAPGHALDAELPRSISGLSGSSCASPGGSGSSLSSSCSSSDSGSSDSGSSDSGGGGGGD